jgi:hypothetical protein
MPSYSNMRSLNLCKTNLCNLFNLKSNIENYFIQLSDFYENAVDKSQNEQEAKKIVERYKSLVSLLQRTKSGDLTAEKALKEVKDTALKSKLGVVLHNIFKACELLFWASAALICGYALVQGVPLLLTPMTPDFLLVMVTSLTVIALALVSSAQKAINCCSQFKSFKNINEESLMANELVTFFKPAVASDTVIHLWTHDQNEQTIAQI